MGSFLYDKQLSEIESIFPADSGINAGSLSEFIEEKKEVFGYKETDALKPVELKSIQANVEIKLDSSRIISANSGLSISSLQEYVPATKLKGLFLASEES